MDDSEKLNAIKNKRNDIEDLRKDWIEKELEVMSKKYCTERSFRRIDTRRGKFKNASKVFIDQGGWDDVEAVKGRGC